MEVVFDSGREKTPRVSIVLLDWSCRESFHSLKYLNGQDTPRDLYEVIWIEYYGARPSELESAVRNPDGPLVDRWVVMGMPESLYYHKHLMYNVGIIEARGDIVVFCDSDAVFSPSFVSSITRAFDETPGMVLHIDEVRNVDKRFYPFNFPSIKDILGPGCINWSGGATTGLLDTEDPIHTLNYGACMCARRQDLIAIGGADEHIDYLGHICGPYEMTFRLVNSGMREVWHRSEFLYHVWHPGTDGKGNRLGPHDGRNFSTTALELKWTRRVLPLVENPAIRALRLGDEPVLYAPILEQALPREEMKKWNVEDLRRHDAPSPGLFLTRLKMIKNQFFLKLKKFTRESHSPRDVVRKVFKGIEFLKNMSQYNSYIIGRCSQCVQRLSSQGIREIAVFGTNDITEALLRISRNSGISVREVYGYDGGGSFLGREVAPVSSASRYGGKIVIAAINGIEEKLAALKRAGVAEERIVII